MLSKSFKRPGTNVGTPFGLPFSHHKHGNRTCAFLSNSGQNEDVPHGDVPRGAEPPHATSEKGCAQQSAAAGDGASVCFRILHETGFALRSFFEQYGSSDKNTSSTC